MVVLAVIICLFSCERKSPKSYCVTVSNITYIALQKQRKQKLCLLYYKSKNFAFFLIAPQ